MCYAHCSVCTVQEAGLVRRWWERHRSGRECLRADSPKKVTAAAAAAAPSKKAHGRVTHIDTPYFVRAPDKTAEKDTHRVAGKGKGKDVPTPGRMAVQPVRKGSKVGFACGWGGDRNGGLSVENGS